MKSKKKDYHLRPPVSVRCTAAETILLNQAAIQLGTSRAGLLRSSALALVSQLQREGALALAPAA
jgi:hypothetical protein